MYVYEYCPFLSKWGREKKVKCISALRTACANERLKISDPQLNPIFCAIMNYYVAISEFVAHVVCHLPPMFTPKVVIRLYQKCPLNLNGNRKMRCRAAMTHLPQTPFQVP